MRERGRREGNGREGKGSLSSRMYKSSYVR